MGRYIDPGFFQYLKTVQTVEETSTGVLIGVDGERLRVDVIRDDLLRLKISQAGQFDEAPTFATCFTPPGQAEFEVEETPDAVTLTTRALRLRVDKQDFALDAYRTDGSILFESYRTPEGRSQAFGWRNSRFSVNRKAGGRDAFFGLGEKTKAFNRRGNEYVLWNTDILAPDILKASHLDEVDPTVKPDSTEFDPYYVSIPFFYHAPAEAGFPGMAGFFIDNGYKAHFEFSGHDVYRCQFCGGQYTEYVFAGPAMKDILAAYTFLTGRMQPPPLWALGHHQCKWHQYTGETFHRVGREMRSRKIPCDVLWLDIEYMDGYRDFTWNSKTFPKPEELLGRIRSEGFRVVTIIDPGVKYEPGCAVYEEGKAQGLFCKTASGQLFTGDVWPGRTVFPDFVKPETRAWWAHWIARHARTGVNGIWNDMNAPATGGGDPVDMRFDRDGGNHPHERYHNQYGFLMGAATRDGLLEANPGQRTFILSRAGFAGIQRYAANWMGDNMSRWEHLAMSIPMAMGFGVSGQPFVGADVGGFAQHTHGELLVRWMQYGALTPFFRNHAEIGAREQYPWSFGPAVEALCREAIALRYRLLPYLYSSFMLSCETGVPIQRPLVFDFQDDQFAREVEDQYLFGDALLVAPIAKPAQSSRLVYLPEGTWYDWHTDRPFAGHRFITAEAPIERIPVLARGGSVIPMLRTAPQTTDGLRVESIDLHVFLPAQDGAFESALHEDDGATFACGQGQFLRTHFTLTRTGRRARLEARVSGRGYPEFARQEFRIKVHAGSAAHVTSAGKPQAATDGWIALHNRGESFVLDLDVR